MKLSDYGYNLPPTLIASQPPLERGNTRLLVLNRTTGQITDSWYRQLGDYLTPGDLLVINNTKVIKARLLTQTDTGAERELLLLEKHGQQPDTHRMKVMYRRHLKSGMNLYIKNHVIHVENINQDGTAVISSTEDLLQLADQYGSVPLPPYMHRQANQHDIDRYQTVFAREAGSVAAPTASLNLTTQLLQQLADSGINHVELTLHVGLGTFMPIRTDDLTEHVMHQEYFYIPGATVQAIQETKARGNRVIAVGTTVCRTLEYVANQLKNASGDLSGEADIFIYPGYSFKVVDAMVTNFHAPHSTVLMMAAAFAGWDHLKMAYDHAITSEYAFLSYGDSMFIH